MTPEHSRLEGARKQHIPWKKWGPYLSERQWGRCARITATTEMRGTSSPTITPVHARTAGARTAWEGLRRQPAALLRPRPVERQGPDPEGAALRPHEQQRQPRRGRQGVLLLPRQHADPLVHEVPLQVPTGGVPLRRLGRDEPAAYPQRDGV